MRSVYILTIFTLLFSCNSLPGIAQDKVDNSPESSKYAKATELPGIYKKTGSIYYNKRDFQKADSAFRNCVIVAQKIKDWKTLGICLNYLGASTKKQGKLTASINYYKQAIRVFEDYNFNRLEGDAWLNLGMVYKNKDVYDSAVMALFEGIQLLEEIKEETSLMKGYNYLGNTMRKTRNWEQAEDYYHKSLNIAQKLKDKKHIEKVYNNLGNLFREKKVKLDSAIHYYYKSLLLKQSRNATQEMASTYLNIGSLLMDLKLYDSALYHLKKSYKMRLPTNDMIGLVRNYLKLGRVYTGLNDIKNAKTYLEKYDSIAKVENIPPHIIYDYMEVKQEIFEREGKFKSALQISKKLLVQKDTLLEPEKQELITSYEAFMKVNTLERAWNEERFKRQEERTRHRQQTTNLIFLLVLILSFVVFLIWYGRRRKKEATKNELLYKELRHRTDNMLEIFSAIIKLKSKNTESKPIKKTLDNIGIQIDALNLTYQKLYQQKKLSHDYIDFKNYLQELLKNLFHGTGITYKPNLQLAPVHLQAKQCNYLGLITNEVVTNAIKYGKSDDGKLRIHIDLRENEHTISFTIKDEGKGFQNKSNFKSRSEGKTLIELLITQLKAKQWEYGGKNGATFSIILKKLR